MSSLAGKLQKESDLDILNKQVSKPVVLSKVEISGGDFSDHYYQTLVDPVLNGTSTLSLGELKTELINIEKRLLNSGLFKDISINLDLDESATLSKTGPIPVKTKINLSQLPIFKFSSYSSTTDYDASAGFRYLDPNFLKHANSLLVDINFNYDPYQNSLNRKVWDLNLLIPFARLPTTRAVFNPSISLIDAKTWAGHEQYSIGAFLGAQSSFFKPSGTGIFTSGFSFTNRQVRNVANSASDVIRTDAGDDFKIGIQSNYRFDTRSLIGKFPVNGILVDITNEFAGSNSLDSFSKASSTDNGPDLHTFNKTVFKFEGVKSFLNNLFTTSVQFESGSIIDKSDGRVHVSDRFTLGGINSLRGFKLNSVGLKDGNDYVGGTSVFKANLSVYTKLPNTSVNSPLRLHNFLNFGDNFNFASISEVSDLIKSGNFVRKSAIATGVGITYKSNNAVIDLSYNVPLSARIQDEAKPGLNFAVSLNFY